MKYLLALLFLCHILNPLKAYTQSSNPEFSKIIIVGSSWVIAKYVRSGVIDLGYTPVFLVKIGEFSEEIANIIRQSQWYEVNINSYQAVEEFIDSHLEELGPIAGITSLSDSKLPIAEKLAEKFNVPGPDKAIRLLSDKNQVCRLIPEYSPRTINFFMDTIPLDAIHDVIDQYKVIVIKPAKGSGALGTIVLREKLDKPALCKRLIEAGAININTCEWLAQTYIEGTLYSLEGYCLNGKPFFLGLTRRSRISMSEMANYFPSDEDPLAKKNAQMLFAGIYALIERSGYKRGYFHCEYLLNENGAYLIDANFGRIGGAAMIEMFAHSFEILPQEILKHVIDVSLFGGRHLSSYRYNSNRKPALNLCYGMKTEEVLKSIRLPKNLSSHHTQAAKYGALIPPIGVSDYSWIGMVAGDRETVLKDIQHIQIETDSGVYPAYYFMD